MDKIAKYNQRVWAVIGTAVLAAVVFACVAALWAAVEARGRRHGEIAAKPLADRKASADEALVYCLPTPIEGTSAVLVGVGVARTSSEQKGSKWSSYGRPSWAACQLGERYGSGTLHNVVVWDLDTGKQRLLLETRGRIERFAQPDPKCAEGEGLVPCGSLYWELTTEDSNGDGTIGTEDATVAYLSDLDGTRLRPLTPKNTSVQGFSSDLRKGLLFFQVRADSAEGDGPIELIKVPLAPDETSSPAVDDQLSTQAENLLL